ncbi:Ribosome modulation factor [Ewingella americana]|uniref:Ribosome modulation factor n=1 Tax=Ewingella americana TaxID=41202 RepID=A0A377NF24_9GAMM|nr:Ribosome modulation factor [Ewingella americana]
MKRQKRDRLERAQSRGYKQELSDAQKKFVRTKQLMPAHHWLGGWRQAMEDRAVTALSGTFVRKGTTSATGGGFCFSFPQMQKSEYAEHIRFFLAFNL